MVVGAEAAAAGAAAAHGRGFVCTQEERGIGMLEGWPVQEQQ